MIGPATLERPQTALKSPWTRARSCSVNRSPSMVSTIGPTAPAPSPWSVRIAINCPIDCDVPDRIEPRLKSTSPKSRIGLRP